jgi:hypothetical protein
MEKTILPALRSMLSRMAFSRCKSAGLDLKEEEVCGLFSQWLDSVQGSGDLAPPRLPFESEVKVFFSPEAKGMFIQCLSAGDRERNSISPHARQTRPSPIVLGKEDGETSLLFEGEAVRVVVHLNEFFHSGRVVTFFRFPSSKEGEWLRQDLPSGEPAETFIEGGSNVSLFASASTARADLEATTSDSSMIFVKESHFSHGLLWDPNKNTPAEICYYPDGGVYWKRRYRGGICRGNGKLPCFEAFWPCATPQIVEYGNAELGKHRPLREGPAYQEFYANGNPAVVMFAERGKLKSCSWFEYDGQKLSLPCQGKSVIPANSLMVPGDILSESSIAPPALSFMWGASKTPPQK